MNKPMNFIILVTAYAFMLFGASTATAQETAKAEKSDAVKIVFMSEKSVAPHQLTRAAVNFQDCNYHRAYIAAKKVLRTQPYHPSANYYAGKSFFIRGDCNRAIGHYRRILKVLPAVFEVLDDLQACYEKTGRTKDAQAVIDRKVLFAKMCAEKQLACRDPVE